MSRSTRISRVDSVPNWLDELAVNLEKQSKTAVEVVRERNISLYEQLSGLIGGGPINSHKTVASKVNEYQDKIGLKEYLKTLSKDKVKTAQEVASSDGQILPAYPTALRDKILVFLENKIKSSKGFISLPALRTEILELFRNEGVKPEEINDPDLAKFIHTQLMNERSKHPEPPVSQNLGKDVGLDLEESDNSDFFAGLMPKGASVAIEVNDDEDNDDFILTPEEEAYLKEQDDFWRDQLSPFSDKQLKEFIQDGAGNNVVNIAKYDGEKYQVLVSTSKGEEGLGIGSTLREALEKAVMYYWQ